MTKRFCDRCGAEIKEKCVKISIVKPPLMFLAPDYDICENCAEEVDKWLHEKEENND